MEEEPMNAPPAHEGNDQEVAEGAEVEPVSEDDLEDAPEEDPSAPDDPEGAAA